MACEFSKDGKYFAEISAEGKLRIWNAASNLFEQEFMPNYHLKTAFTCFSFITGTSKSPRRKKRRIDEDPGCTDDSDAIAIGTSTGRLLIYSIAKGDVEYTINNETNRTISCLSSSNDLVYSGVDENIVVWNLSKRNVLKQWKAGNDRVCSVLVIPDKNQLLTASRNIKLWDLKTKTELKTYTGHASEVSLLHYVSPDRRSQSTGAYFLSGSKNDRTLNCWNLSQSADGKAAAATFLMEDIPKAISVCAGPEGSTWLAVTVRSGITHVYNHILNGKSKGLLNPKKHIQVISDSTKRLEGIITISISAAIYQDCATLRLAYGNEIGQTFEDIDPIKYKFPIIRQDPRAIAKSTEADTGQVKSSIEGNDVHYLAPQTGNSQKHKSQDRHKELAMQNRFENLTLNHLDDSTSSTVPKPGYVVQLLVQGLQSNDKNILKNALMRKNSQTVKNTIKILPAPMIIPLVKKLTEVIQANTLSKKVGALWLKNLLLIHASILMTNSEMPDLFNVIVGSIKNRINQQASRNQLEGRLTLLLGQIHASTEQDSTDYAPALTIVDKDSDASDNDVIELDGLSGSDYDWGEEEEEKEEEGEEDSDVEVDGENSDEMDDSD